MELFEDERGKPRGCGIVEFEKIEHARIALDKMNRYELKGRRLIVKEVRIPYTLLIQSTLSYEDIESVAWASVSNKFVLCLFFLCFLLFFPRC